MERRRSSVLQTRLGLEFTLSSGLNTLDVQWVEANAFDRDVHSHAGSIMAKGLFMEYDCYDGGLG